MTKLLLAVLAAAALAAPARAAGDDWWLNAGGKGTGGSRGYVGTDWWAKLGKGDYSVKPELSTYKSDFSSGTYKTFQVRGAYDTKLLGVGVSAGGTPKVNGYSSAFFGADAILSLTPGMKGPEKRISSSDESSGPARGKDLARVDIGGAYKHIAHRDEFQSAASGQIGKPGGRVARRANAVTIGENALTGSAGVSLMDVLLSVDVTKSVYDRDIAGANARAAQVQRLSGLSGVVQGFPDTNTAVRLELGMMPVVTPYVTYVHTKYEVQQPDSNGVTAGAYVELGIVEASGSYEHFTQSGQPDQNLFSVGATLRF